MDAAQTSPGRRLAVVATPGGHLVQALRIAALLEASGDNVVLWISNLTPQTEVLLEGRNVMWLKQIPARGVWSALRETPKALRAIRAARVDTVLSTGASVSFAVLPFSRLVGASPEYVESLARPDILSLSARVFEKLPWVKCFTQYSQNVSDKWNFQFSIFDSYKIPPTHKSGSQVSKIFVSLGSAQPWEFTSLVTRLSEQLPDDIQVRWQLGCTREPDGLQGTTYTVMPADEFKASIEWADLFVTHAGVGNLLTCLDTGKRPLMVPRRSSRGEHVDDHQVQIALQAQEKGLADYREVEDLVLDHFFTVAGVQE